MNLFRKVRANCCLLPCDASQEPNGNCSDRLVQMSFFILGGFLGADVPPLIVEGAEQESQHSAFSKSQYITARETKRKTPLGAIRHFVGGVLRR